MGKFKSLHPQEINTGSTADIAFLLLIFFLVVTTITRDKGLMLKLPPKVEVETIAPIKERNLFKILINSNDQLLIENELNANLSSLRTDLKHFILNNGHDPTLSESPEKAVISLKTNRGTSYGLFIAVLDELKGAYYEIYADRVGLTADQFRELDLSDPDEYAINERGRRGLPMNISIAEPTR